MLTVEGIDHSFADPLDVHRALQRSRVRAGFAEWLDSYEFDTWATFTFRPEHWPVVLMESVRRHVEWFGDHHNLDPMFYVAEEGGIMKRLHAHALLNRNGRSLKLLWGSWHSRFGRCRFTPLQSSTEGVRQYVTKYAIKDALWWQIKTGGSTFRDL